MRLFLGFFLTSIFSASLVSAYKLRKKWHQGVAEAHQGIIDVTVLQPSPTDHQGFNLENTSEGLSTASDTEGVVPVKIHVKHHHNVTNVETDAHESSAKHTKDTAEALYTIKNSGTSLKNEAQEEADKTVQTSEATSEYISTPEIENSNHLLKEPVSASESVPLDKNSYYEIINTDHPVHEEEMTVSKQVTLLNHPYTTALPLLVSSKIHDHDHETNINEETKISGTAVDSLGQIVKNNEDNDQFVNLLEKLEQEAGTHTSAIHHPAPLRKVPLHSFPSSAHEKLLEMVNELKEIVQQMQVSSETPQVIKTLSTSMINSLTSNFHQNDNKITLQEIEDALKKAVSTNEHKPDYQTLGLLKNAFESVVKDIQKTHETLQLNLGSIQNADLHEPHLEPQSVVSESSKIIQSEGNDILNEKPLEKHVTTEEQFKKLPFTTINSVHLPSDSKEHSIVNRLQNVKKILEEIINLVLHESEATREVENPESPIENHYKQQQQMHIRVKFIDLTGHDKPIVENGEKKMLVPSRVRAAVVPIDIYKKSHTNLSKVLKKNIKLVKGEESKAVILTRTKEDRSKVLAAIYRRAIKSVLKTIQNKKLKRD